MVTAIDVQDIFTEDYRIKNVPKDCVAITASAIRCERWLDLFEHFISTNEHNLIFIFCGNIKPDFELPDNFFYVFSEQNPATCNEICLRLAQSIPEVKYIMTIADDCYFSENVVDVLVSEISKHQDELIEIGIGFWGDAVDNLQEPLPLKYHNHDDGSYDLTICGMRTKTTCKKVGSIDKRFKGQYWDVDRTLRLLALGGKIKSIEHLRITEMESSHDGTSTDSHLLGWRFYNHDRPLLDSLWTLDRRGGKCSDFRMDSLQEYEDAELLGEIQINE
tara:strand:+ start:4697 stop:5524 length:828 start_codon:yes stop_codon:yes gene_type:complete